jgi:hypothetical protein
MVPPNADLSALRGLPYFDEATYLEAVVLYSRLTLENYCRHATELLNGPTVNRLIDATAGLRAVANSITVYSASPDGLIPLSLFYFVNLCEGLLMPHLQPMVTLCEEQGHVGPVAARSGQHEELKKAKTDFGPALKFLAAHGEPIFAASAPAIGNRLKDYDAVRLSQLRNSVAHFNFRLEIVRTHYKDDPAFPKDARLRVVAEAMLQSFLKALRIHNPHGGQIVDMKKSMLRWEGSMGKLLTNASAAISFHDVRTMVEKLESFAFSLVFAFVEAGASFGSKLIIGMCAACNEGHVVVPATETQATCPACRATHALPPAATTTVSTP